MKKKVKRLFKRNSHNVLFKALAGFGRALNRFYENRNHDIYSNGELAVLEKLSNLNSLVILDGGANTGHYSLLANKLNPKTQIYSFEPVASTYKKLKENIHLYYNISPIQKGLYKENCSKEINIFPSDTHASLYDIQGLSYKSIRKEEITLVKGDDFMREAKIPQVDLLKLDMEGAEYNAIMGFEDHIKNGKIKVIQFEYGYINITTKHLLKDFYTYFENKGYIIGKVFPKNVEFREYQFKYEDFLGPNFIAVKKSETELINLLKRK
tara:strand:- start:47451 stop:48251 length:801 start_codon:yes stop_codon:yes gene_type:complete